MAASVADFVVARFNGQLAFAIDQNPVARINRGENWRELDRYPVPPEITLDQAITLYHAGKLRKLRHAVDRGQ